jgi:hypothetical protein
MNDFGFRDDTAKLYACAVQGFGRHVSVFECANAFQKAARVNTLGTYVELLDIPSCSLSL